jgi:hypothetical protein
MTNWKLYACAGAILLGATAGAQRADKFSQNLRPGEMSVTAAGKIAKEFARKLGLKGCNIDSYVAFIRPFGQHQIDREWLIHDGRHDVGYQFCINAKTGRVNQYMDWALNQRELSAGQVAPGAYARTRSALTAHTLAVLRRLDLPTPAYVRLNLGYDHKGQVKGPSYGVMVSFASGVYDYMLKFSPATGALTMLSVQTNGPTHPVEPKLVVKPGRSDISKARAVAAAVAFVEAAGLPGTRTEDWRAILNVGPTVKRRNWLVLHPRYRINVDAAKGKVLQFWNQALEERFEKGDPVVCKSNADAVSFMRSLGAKIGLPADMRVTAKITNGTISCLGWVGAIEGDFYSGGKWIAYIRCDLY